MAYQRGQPGRDPARKSIPVPFGRNQVQGRFPARRAYAALDLGTNNCRMLIARPDGEGFQIIDAFSRIVRLGEGLGASGRISDIAMDRTVSALTVCAAKIARRNVDLARSVATEACRKASNGREFVDRVWRETGIRLDIIDPEEEARLAMLGCYRLLGDHAGPALIFDIGGGSTELVLIEARDGEPEIVDWQSIPWGVVSLAESMDQDPACEGDRLTTFDAMKARLVDQIQSFAARHAARADGVRLLGTSGTVTTLASVHLGLPSYDRRQIDGLYVPTVSFREISRDLARRSIADRALVPCIGNERADLVVAGCAILDVILDHWPCEDVGVADRGIREGILRQLVHLDRRG